MLCLYRGSRDPQGRPITNCDDANFYQSLLTSHVPRSAAAVDSVQEYSAVGVRVASEQGLAWWELVLGLAQSEPAMAVVRVELELLAER